MQLESILTQLRDFIVVWITQVIYYNHIYPENVFEERKYLDVIVNQSRAPPLNDYLKAFANRIIGILIEKNGGGKVHDVVVLVYNETTLHVLKRYLVNFSQFVGLAGQISSLDFLENGTHADLARLNIPGMTSDNIYSYLRSLIFFHVEELKRTEEVLDNKLFFKLLVNMDGEVDLSSSEEPSWVRLTSEKDTRRTKFVPIGEMSVGFMCFDLHNEYVI